MQRRINQKVESYTHTLKEGIQKNVIDALENIKKMLPEDNSNEINSILTDMMQNIYDIPQITLDEEDFVRRKRAKNVVPFYDRCHAKRANNEQCTRRKKDGSDFCGTHSKGTPHGVVDTSSANGDTVKNATVWTEEICGIMYYIDDSFNVYQTEDIMLNKVNPKVIAKYEKRVDNQGQVSYYIPDFNIE